MTWPHLYGSASTTVSITPLLEISVFAPPELRRRTSALLNNSTIQPFACTLEAVDATSASAGTNGTFPDELRAAEADSEVTSFHHVTSACSNDSSSSATSIAGERVCSLSVEELAYQILVVEPLPTLDDPIRSSNHKKGSNSMKFKEPSDLVQCNIQELRLYLPSDVLAIPFDWIGELLSAPNESFPALKRVEILIQSPARPYITDLIDAHTHERFLSMMSHFNRRHVTLGILFRTPEGQTKRDNCIDLHCFRAVDTSTLFQAIEELSRHEHTYEITTILAEESRVPTEEACGYRKNAHGAGVEDDEML
jgi:hypothetical protein